MIKSINKIHGISFTLSDEMSPPGAKHRTHFSHCTFLKMCINSICFMYIVDHFWDNVNILVLCDLLIVDVAVNFCVHMIFFLYMDV